MEEPITGKDQSGTPSQELQIRELKDEVGYLRSRNLSLQMRIEELEKEIAGLRKSHSGEEAPGSTTPDQNRKKKKPGRKKNGEEWQRRYEDIRAAIRSGERPVETIRRLGISKATYYRFRDAYMQSLTKAYAREGRTL